MNIFVRDDQGLDTVLMMDGYSKEQRQSAKQAIRAQFRETASKVFQEVLGKPLPESITVNMAISDREEMKGESAARLASFNVELSRGGSCVFTIREITVKTILEQSLHYVGHVIIILCMAITSNRQQIDAMFWHLIRDVK